MADATTHLSLSPATSYSTRNNIKFPGSSTRATAEEVKAATRINDGLKSGVTISGTTGTIVSDGET
jgi:hypothetical protein